MDAEARNALQSFGFICRDVRPRKGVGHSSALPALGLGQWAKLQLWSIEAERVIYLDSDVLVLRDVLELFSALDGGEPLAAPNDYLSGGVLVLKPGPEPFDKTLAEDSGLYVYGEQDFLNVAFPEWKEINRSYNVQGGSWRRDGLEESARSGRAHFVHERVERHPPYFAQHLMCRPRLDPTCTAKRGRDAFGCCQDVQPPYVT